MADEINKKISIDVNVSSDGRQQIDEYKASFDSLRSAIKALDNDLSNFTNSVNALNTQNQSLASSGNKVKETVIISLSAISPQSNINARFLAKVIALPVQQIHFSFQPGNAGTNNLHRLPPSAAFLPH